MYRNLTMCHGLPAVDYIDLETCLYGVIETSGSVPVSVSIDEKCKVLSLDVVIYWFNIYFCSYFFFSCVICVGYVFFLNCFIIFIYASFTLVLV